MYNLVQQRSRVYLCKYRIFRFLFVQFVTFECSQPASAPIVEVGEEKEANLKDGLYKLLLTKW